MKIKARLVLSGVILLVACGCSRRDAGESGFLPLSATSHNNLVVMLSSMSLNGTGKIVKIQLTTGAVTGAEHPVSSNAGLRYFAGRKSLYAINRFGSDSLQAFFVNGLRSALLQLALPQEKENNLENSFEDIWVDREEKFAYVSRLNGTKLLKLDLATRQVVHRTDLSDYADADGLPEMSRLIEENGKLLVQLQRLNRSGNLWPPAGGASLAIVDVETGELESAIATIGQNPFTDFSKEMDGRIYYGTSGEWDKFCENCGLESVSLATKDKKLHLDEGTLKGKIVTFALGLPYYFLVTHPHGEKGTELLAVKSTTGERTILSRVPYVEEYQSLAYDAERRLLFAGRKSANQPVIEIWSTETLTRVNEIKTDLAPVQLILVP